MGSAALVSVVMPAYNASRTIEKSIRSVLCQTYGDLELLVIDDCSSDGTEEVVARLAQEDSRIRLLNSERNSGSPATPRNIGLEKAKGRYVAFLDADDTWAAGKLDMQLRLMDMVGAGISCTGYQAVDANERSIGVFVPPAVVGYKDLLSENTLGCSTVMIDLTRVSAPRFPMCGHEDYALWLELTRSGLTVHSLPDTLASYQVAPGSVSSNKFKVLGYFWNIYRNLEGFSLLRSFFYCGRYAWNVRAKYSREPQEGGL